MTAKTNKRKDFNEIAVEIGRIATGETVPEPTPKLTGRAKAGQLGGLKGGAARAKKLTAQERSEIAKKAAAKRWGS
jgi:hypothetical protein